MHRSYAFRSSHDAGGTRLRASMASARFCAPGVRPGSFPSAGSTISDVCAEALPASPQNWLRSEEHTSELQSLTNLVCRLLLEKKKKKQKTTKKITTRLY